jgi:hypothetical protein
VHEALLKNIKRRMTPQPVKIRADVELTCFAYDGVERIRDAMRAAEALGNEECPVRMKLVAPPLYVLTTATLDKTKGVEVSEAQHTCLYVSGAEVFVRQVLNAARGSCRKRVLNAARGACRKRVLAGRGAVHGAIPWRRVCVVRTRCQTICRLLQVLNAVLQACQMSMGELPSIE